MTPAGVIPRLKQFTVAGIFEAGIVDADAGLALVHMQDAQTLYQLGEAVSGVRLKLDDLFAAREVAYGCFRSCRATYSPRTGRAATRTSSAPSRSRSA